MKGKKYWTVRSSSYDGRGGGHHCIEADTGEIAVEIAERHLIGRIDKGIRKGYIPDSWSLREPSHPGMVARRARGFGGKVHYENELGEHKTRTEEEVMREIDNGR